MAVLWLGIAHPTCDVTVSIWDLYSVHPWPNIPSRTNYCGKAEATTCPPRACWWAVHSAYSERWKSAGSRAVIWAVTADAWGHKCAHRSKQKGVFWGDIYPLRANEAVRGAQRETGSGSETWFFTKRQILQYSQRIHAYNKAMIIARNDVSSQKVAENGQIHSITDQTHPDFTRLADVKAKILCG